MAERHCLCTVSLFAPRLPAGSGSRTAPRPAPDPAQHRRGAAAAWGRWLRTQHLQGKYNDRTGCATGLVPLGIAEEERQRNKALMWLFVLLNLSGWGVLLRNKDLVIEGAMGEKEVLGVAFQGGCCSETGWTLVCGGEWLLLNHFFVYIYDI